MPDFREMNDFAFQSILPVGNCLIKGFLLILIIGIFLLLFKKISPKYRHFLYFSSTMALPLVILATVCFSLLFNLSEMTADYRLSPAPVSVEAQQKNPGFINLTVTMMSIKYAHPEKVKYQPPSLFTSLFMIWIAGVLINLVYTLLGIFYLMNISKNSQLSKNKKLVKIIPEAAKYTGLKKIPPVIVSHDFEVPFTFHFIKPKIIIPFKLLELSEKELLGILLHEMAHIKRNDYLTQLTARLACSFFWFIPILWMNYKKQRVEQEKACDEMVVRNGIPQADYALQLVQINRFTHKKPAFIAAFMVGAKKTIIEDRVVSILKLKLPKPPDHLRHDYKKLFFAFILLMITFPLAVLTPLAGWNSQQLLIAFLKNFNNGAEPLSYYQLPSNAGQTSDIPLLWPVSGGDGIESLEKPEFLKNTRFLTIRLKTKTPIVAVADGYIESARWSKNTGFQLSIRHSDGLKTVYRNLKSPPLLFKNSKVRRGQFIGYSGGPDRKYEGENILYYSIEKNHIPVNPVKYLLLLGSPVFWPGTEVPE